jgi:flavin-dependent dehydrogenase
VNTDIAIIGAGPAGVATACASMAAGAAVVLIDDSSTTRRPVRLDEALAPAVRRRLTALGLEAALDDREVARSTGVRGRWGTADIERSFLFDPNGDGFVVDRWRFDRRLRTLATRLGLPVLVDTARGLTRSGDRWQIELGRQAGTVAARWVVDATGRAAWVGRRLGARPCHDDRLVAVVGTGRLARRVARVTMVEAIEAGWWYAFGSDDSRATAALVTDADLARAGGYRSPAVWRSELARTSLLGPALAGFELDGMPSVVPCGNVRLDQPCGPGWLAVGDAAVAHDPLAGSGVVRALDSGIEAATVLAAAAGRRDVLDRYHESCRERFATHLARSAAFHRREPRWPGSPYWARRAGTGQLVT